MSLYGDKFKIGGLSCGLVLRGGANGEYRVVFEREYASLEQIEASPVWTLAARTFDLHHDPALNQGNIMTEYEEKFSSMDHPICKLIARRSAK